MRKKISRGIFIFAIIQVSILSIPLSLEASSPEIHSITPDRGSSTQPTQVTIRGAGFNEKTKASLFRGGPYIAGSWNMPPRENYWDVYVNGTYAYVADGDSGLQVIDIANPTSPRKVGSCNTPDFAQGVYVNGTYAYVADGESGLQVIDITNPTDPQKVGFCDTPGFAEDVYVSGSYAYVADGESGLQIIDITNPTSPQKIGSCDTPDFAKGVYVSGLYAYVADVSGLQVIDIDTPSSPHIVGSCDMPDSKWAVYVTGSYAYVTNGSSGLQVIDITNPTGPRIVGSCDTPGWAVDVHVFGTYAYVADGNSGLQVIDITNPIGPQIVGYCDTPDWTNGVYIAGTYAYVADSESGLRVIDITNPTNPQKIGSFDTPHSIQGIYVSGSYAYMSVTGLDSGLLKIMDIANPSNPQPVGSCNISDLVKGIYIDNTYAYVANGGLGLQIIDVANPSNPHPVGFCDTPGSAQDVYVIGSYAYVADGNSGLQVVDVTNPSNPHIIGSWDTQSEANEVYISGSYAYIILSLYHPGGCDVCGWSYSSPYWSFDFMVIDISNPSSPQHVGSCNLSSRSFIYNDMGGTQGVYVTGSYAYVADGNSGLQVINITDPTSPHIVGSCDVSGVASDVYVSGSYAYVADGNSGLQVIDITDPTNPQKIGSCNTPSWWGGSAVVYVTGSYAYVAGDPGLQVIDITVTTSYRKAGLCDTPDESNAVYVSGTYAYVADGESGLQVIDITNPSSPHIAGSCDTPGWAYDVRISGTYAYVADGESVLQVIDITNPSSPHIAGSCDTPGRVYGVHVTGTYAYVADGDSGLLVIDIVDPLNPHIVGSCDTPDWSNAVYVSGTYAYVGDDDSGLLVIDIVDPLNPHIVGSCDMPDWAQGIYVSGSYAYVADDDSGLLVIDITNPSNPKSIGTYDISGGAYDVHVSGSYAYVAGSGLQVIDITDPISPQSVAFCYTLSWAQGVYISGSYVYVAGGDMGLQVVSAFMPLAEITYIDSNTIAAAVPAGLLPDIYDLYVSNTDSEYTLMRNAFTVPTPCMSYYKDSDGDTYGVDGDNRCLYAPDGEYTATQGGDCDDANPNTYPGAPELCDGRDNDCDDGIDDPNELTYATYYADSDGDGRGDPNKPRCASNLPQGYVPNTGDCNDKDKDVYTGAMEICDGKDNDCDGQMDGEGSQGCAIYYKDEDEDGQGVEGESRCLCSPDVQGAYTAIYSGDPDDFDSCAQGTILMGNMSLPAGWSMISLPLLPENASASSLFPGATVVYGFRKDTGYIRMKGGDELKVGEGYWIQLPHPQKFPITGRRIERYTLPVSNGWYMIGGCTLQSVASISASYGDIGGIYRYMPDAGYQRVLTSKKLEPNKGYWALFDHIDAQTDLSVETVVDIPDDISDNIPDIRGNWEGTWDSYLTDPNGLVVSDPNTHGFIITNSGGITFNITNQVTIGSSPYGNVQITGWDVDEYPAWDGETEEIKLNGYFDQYRRWFRAYYYNLEEDTLDSDYSNLISDYSWIFDNLKITDTCISGHFRIWGSNSYKVTGKFNVKKCRPRTP